MIGNPRTVRHKWQFNGVDIPGASCDNGCSLLSYTKRGVTQQDAGLYSCIGWNELGYGPPATAELFVKRKYRQWVLPVFAVTRKESAKFLLTSLLRETGQYPRAFPVGGTLVAMLISLGERVGAERKSKVLNLT